MNNLASKINTTLAEVDALSIKPPKVELQYGSTGYDKEHSFVIKGLIPECSFASIYGPSGSYKSFLALDWACHIASGKDWDGHKVNQGSVLYVAGEGGFGVTKRVRAWELQNQVDSIDNLARLPGPVFPADIDQMNIVIEYCDEIETRTGHAVKLIIFDTLARCYGGRDENSSQDMGAFIRGCGSIQQLTGATVLVVHHSGKNVDKGGRGSSSLPAALDVEYLVSRDGEGNIGPLAFRDRIVTPHNTLQAGKLTNHAGHQISFTKMGSTFGLFRVGANNWGENDGQGFNASDFFLQSSKLFVEHHLRQ